MTRGAGTIEDDSGTDNEIKRQISMSVPRLLRRPLCVFVSLWLLVVGECEDRIHGKFLVIGILYDLLDIKTLEHKQTCPE
jgi:hypothetical protein